jgi:hypothetical protein
MVTVCRRSLLQASLADQFGDLPLDGRTQVFCHVRREAWRRQAQRMTQLTSSVVTRCAARVAGRIAKV